MESFQRMHYQFNKSWKNKYKISNIKFSDSKSKGQNIPNKTIIMNKISSMYR